MTLFESIKAMNIDETAKFLSGLQIMVIETLANKIFSGYEVSEEEKTELLKEIRQALVSEVPSE